MMVKKLPANKWSEVEFLVKELEKIEGINSVSKGRFFKSHGLAPTFQVYMALMFYDQYKLLARSGNKVHKIYMALIFYDQYKLLARSGNKVQEVVDEKTLY